MIKVRHSRARRMLVLDFAGDIGGGEVREAAEGVGHALGEMKKGYTLVEVFRGHPHFTASGAMAAGELASACYSGNRIWMAVRVEGAEYGDPGMSILHKTRWKRGVPEVQTDTIGKALAMAKEEAREQGELAREYLAADGDKMGALVTSS